MPAGDLVVADWTIELRSTLMGDGTNYELGPSGEERIVGLGVPVPKTADVDLLHDDGAYGSPDYQGVRVISIPFLLRGTPAQAMGYLKDLHTVWAPSTTDLPLYIQLPGFGKFYVNGRPRGLLENTRWAHFGEVTAEATFVALDPTITYV